MFGPSAKACEACSGKKDVVWHSFLLELTFLEASLLGRLKIENYAWWRLIKYCNQLDYIMTNTYFSISNPDWFSEGPHPCAKPSALLSIIGSVGQPLGSSMYQSMRSPKTKKWILPTHRLNSIEYLEISWFIMIYLVFVARYSWRSDTYCVRMGCSWQAPEGLKWSETQQLTSADPFALTTSNSWPDPAVLPKWSARVGSVATYAWADATEVLGRPTCYVSIHVIAFFSMCNEQFWDAAFFLTIPDYILWNIRVLYIILSPLVICHPTMAPKKINNASNNDILSCNILSLLASCGIISNHPTPHGKTTNENQEDKCWTCSAL